MEQSHQTQSYANVALEKEQKANSNYVYQTLVTFCLDE
jgi:hypothetical protein